jgi:hypothetical protein
MLTKRTLLSAFLAFSLLFAYGQKSLQNIDGLKKNAISFTILGPTPIIGITYERILASRLSMELGAGLPSIGLGIKVFPTKVQVEKPMFHIGLTGTYFASQESEFTPPPALVIYILIGLSVFRKGGFNFAFDMGPAYAFDIANENSWDRFTPYGNLKFGFRF